MEGNHKPGNGRSPESSEALHYHYLVKSERRPAYLDIIRRSLHNYPKDGPADSLNPATPNGTHGVLPITGTFLVLSDSTDDSHWIDPRVLHEDFARMGSLGFDTVVLLTGVADMVCYPSEYLKHSADVDLVNEALKEAEGQGFKVLVAVPNLLVDWMLAEPDELKAATLTTRLLVDELLARYGHYRSFAGWYLPYELCNVFIENKPDPQMLPAWIGSLCSVCRDASPGKSVAIAPYFSTVSAPEKFEALWDMVLGETGVDILAMQDGVGIYGEDRLAELDMYYSILKKSCARRGVSLWADSEVFHQTSGIPIDDGAWTAQPATADRLARQQAILSRYVEKIIIFCFSNYMSPHGSDEAADLFRKYSNSLKSLRSKT